MLSASTVPTTAPSTRTVTRLPGSAVPAMVGRGSASSTPATGVVTTGAAGGTVSTVKLTGAEGGETLPAASRAVALAVCGPSARAWPAVRV